MVLKRTELAKLPTPLDYYGEVAGNRVFIKRDDLTDLLLGGNKARKLEYFLHDAICKKADVIVTIGSAQSNHCRMTAAAASKLGIECILLLIDKGDVNFNGNILLYSLLDTQIIWISPENSVATIQSSLEMLRSKGKVPYYIDGGGHGNLGTHAYKEAFTEITNQKNDVDYIFHATGTGTTQAGLVAGSLASTSVTKIIGISIARTSIHCSHVIYESIKDYATCNDLPIKDYKDSIIVDDTYIGQGYGDIYPEVIQTIKHVLKKSAILLDPIYTGKAFYGMINYLMKNNIKNKEIVFVHTGGTPLVFNESESFKKVDVGVLEKV